MGSSCESSSQEKFVGVLSATQISWPVATTTVETDSDLFLVLLHMLPVLADTATVPVVRLGSQKQHF